MPALKPEVLAAIQQNAAERCCTKEALKRFAERYAQHCDFGPDRKPIGAIPRLRLALKRAQKGWGKEMAARGAALIRDVPDARFAGRRIFDIELPADDWNPEPYTIRILTDAAVSVVITVLPPEFRADMAAKKKHRELRRIIDDEIETERDELTTENVELPPPVEVRSSLADKLRTALSK